MGLRPALTRVFARVGDGAKRTEFGFQESFAEPVHVALILEPVANDVGHRDHLQAVFGAELFQLRDAGHAAVLVHDLADDTGRRQSGHARQIHRRFGLPRSHEDATFLGSQRKYVARPRQIGGLAGRVDASEDRTCAVGGRDSGGDSGASVHRLTECRAEVGSISRRDEGQPQKIALLASHRQTDQPAAMGRHEVDDLRRDFLSRNREIAFVLTIFVIHDDQNPPGANLFDSFGNRHKRHTLMVAQPGVSTSMAQAASASDRSDLARGARRYVRRRQCPRIKEIRSLQGVSGLARDHDCSV